MAPVCHDAETINWSFDSGFGWEHIIGTVARPWIKTMGHVWCGRMTFR